MKKIKIVIGTEAEVDNDPSLPTDEFHILLWDTTGNRRLLARYSGKRKKTLLLVGVAEILKLVERELLDAMKEA